MRVEMVTLYPLLLLLVQAAGQHEGVPDPALQVSGWSTRLFGHGRARLGRSVATLTRRRLQPLWS